MDFKDKTRDEINTIIRQANEELANYDKRGKTKVYRNAIGFHGPKCFIRPENAKADIIEYLKYGKSWTGEGMWEDGITLEVTYLTDAEMIYCRDYDEYMSHLKNKEAQK